MPLQTSNRCSRGEPRPACAHESITELYTELYVSSAIGQERTKDNLQESMGYQLVLQFRGHDCPDFDAVGSLEDEL